MLCMMALGWRFVGAFFELWLEMISLDLWLGIEGKHNPGCGLVILVTGVNV